MTDLPRYLIRRWCYAVVVSGVFGFYLVRAPRIVFALWLILMRLVVALIPVTERRRDAA